MHQIRGFHGPHALEAGRKHIRSHGQVLVHFNSVHALGKADASVVPTGRGEHLEQGIGHRGGVPEVAQDLAHAGVYGVEVYLVALIGGPEFQGGGTLQELAHTLRVFYAGQFDEDFAGVAHLLDVGLGYAKTVDTVAEHVEGVVNGALGLTADYVNDLGVGGVVGHFVAELIGGENLCQTTLGSHLVPGFCEQADEVCAGGRVIGLGLRHGGHEVRIRAVAGKGLHQVFQLDLQHDVHTALEVQTQVNLFFFHALVGVSEEHLFRADGVNVGSVSDVGHGVLYILTDFCGHIVRLDKLQGLFLCVLGSLVLLDAGYRGEGKLPDAGDGQQNGYESDPTFALHFCICFKLFVFR